MRKLTVSEIFDNIKKLSHDLTLPSDLLITFCNQALNDIDNYADYNFQIVRNEQVTIPPNTNIVSLANPVKRIIKVEPENTQIIINGGNLELKNISVLPTIFVIDYIKAMPEFDGTEANNVLPDSDLLIMGATYYALLYNNQQEFVQYYQFFKAKLVDFARKNEFILPMPQVEDEGLKV